MRTRLTCPHWRLHSCCILQRYREVENLTVHYITMLGAYRFLYSLNWVYRAHTEYWFQHRYAVYAGGFTHVAMCVVFFFYYSCTGPGRACRDCCGSRLAVSAAAAGAADKAGEESELQRPLIQTV